MRHGADFGRPAGTLFKGTPQLAVKRKADTDWQTRDRTQSALVKLRSKGQCEVIVAGRRCTRRGFEVHHHIGGWKLRGRGDSALARHKTHACTACHREITGNLLEHVAGNRYRRIA